jgi:hypothetical protein
MHITFEKDRYHEQHLMEQWCRDNIGQGGWHTIDSEPAEMEWWMNCMFGRTTFAFKNKRDYTLFLLRWL